MKIDRMLLMESQQDMENGADPNTPMKTFYGVMCIQQGKIEEHVGNINAIVLV